MQNYFFDKDLNVVFRDPVKINNRRLIRSVSGSQLEIFFWIRALYCPHGFDLDCTYGKGNFYRTGIEEPRYKLDIFPRSRDTLPGDSTALPFKSNSFKSVVFDPPFFPYGGEQCQIKFKYGGFNSIDELWQMYRGSLNEIHRILKPQGILVFKCQDFICGRQQFLIHADIIKYAQHINFYPKDIFISLRDHVAIGHNHHNQKHSRKFHCYFIIFEKKIRTVRKLSLQRDTAKEDRV